MAGDAKTRVKELGVHRFSEIRDEMILLYFRKEPQAIHKQAMALQQGQVFQDSNGRSRTMNENDDIEAAFKASQRRALGRRAAPSTMSFQASVLGSDSSQFTNDGDSRSVLSQG